MEKTIYDEIVTRLTDSNVVAWIQSLSYVEPQDIKWFEDQVEQMVAAAASDNKTYPMDLPAVLIEFAPTQYKSKGNKREGSGVVTLHVVQMQVGLDGASGASTHGDFKTMVGYKDLFIQLLDGFALSCNGRLTNVGSEMDHQNRPVRDDRVSFNWTATIAQPSGVPE